MGKAKMTRPGLAVLLAMILALALAVPANAAPPPGLSTCVATPRLTITESDTTPGEWDWRVRGGGACVAAKGTLTIFIIGEGTSTGLGLCSGLLVQNLDIEVFSVVERVFSGEVYTQTNHWVATITTFPLATPFIVQNAAGTASVGAGVIFSHIFLRCPGDNPAQESSTVTWVQDFRASSAPAA